MGIRNGRWLVTAKALHARVDALTESTGTEFSINSITVGANERGYAIFERTGGSGSGGVQQLTDRLSAGAAWEWLNGFERGWDRAVRRSASSISRK